MIAAPRAGLLMPTALATARPVQYVAFPGGSEHGSAGTFATVFAAKGRFAWLASLIAQQPVPLLRRSVAASATSRGG
jgi:hypothetical protein